MHFNDMGSDHTLPSVNTKYLSSHSSHLFQTLHHSGSQSQGAASPNSVLGAGQFFVQWGHDRGHGAELIKRRVCHSGWHTVYTQ